MKKHEVSEEFLKEAYDAACNEWKEKLEKEFPKVFTSYFKFGEEFELDLNMNPNIPVFIGNSIVRNELSQKCLVVHPNWVLTTEVFQGSTILKFKKKEQ